jgi:hypothetical protein
MIPDAKFLHHPIQAEVHGQLCTFLTIGHVANALRRTTWCIKHWERLGLFPETPFMLHPDVPRTKRRLYPVGFVDALRDIAAHGYIGKRLDYEQWQRFHDEVFAAYRETVTTLMDRGVVAGQLDEGAGNEGVQGNVSDR